VVDKRASGVYGASAFKSCVGEQLSLVYCVIISRVQQDSDCALISVSVIGLASLDLHNAVDLVPVGSCFL